MLHLLPLLSWLLTLSLLSDINQRAIQFNLPHLNFSPCKAGHKELLKRLRTLPFKSQPLLSSSSRSFWVSLAQLKVTDYAFLLLFSICLDWCNSFSTHCLDSKLPNPIWLAYFWLCTDSCPLDPVFCQLSLSCSWLLMLTLASIFSPQKHMETFPNALPISRRQSADQWLRTLLTLMPTWIMPSSKSEKTCK